MTAVGGEQSSGFSIEGLKYKDDYLVLSTLGDKINILSLKTKEKSPIVLEHLDSFICKDLKITCINLENQSTSSSREDIDISPLLKTIKECFKLYYQHQ